MIWFTSDTHFGHKNIITYCNRPFVDVQQMNTMMILNWNRLVKPEDTVYHLGDVSFIDEKWTASILRKLKGRKVLIKGNHDHGWTGKYFDEVYHNLLLPIEGQKIYMSHKYGIDPFGKPTNEWAHKDKGAWHLHGHAHGMAKPDVVCQRCDVGVDCWNYSPVSFEKLKIKLNQ